MDTTVVPISQVMSESVIPSIVYLVKQRSVKLRSWLEDFELSDRLSGTLKKNANIGFKHLDQLKHEAICQTLGWGWQITQSSRVTFNDPISEGDCHALTETGWFADRWLKQHLFPEDHFELKYIIYDSGDGVRTEGVGLICRATSIQWIQGGEIVFCFIAEFDNKEKKWLDAVNPF